MAQKTNNNWLKPLIIGGTIIIIFLLILGFGSRYGFQFYIKYGQPKVEAEETVAEEEGPTETTIVEEKATAETFTEVVPEGIIPEPYESEGGIPYSGSEWTCDVAPDEIECLSVGPGESVGVEFKGGANPDRGGIFIFLPGEQVIRYQASKLIEGSNWHGAYDYNRVPKENDWKLLLDDRVKAMMEAPNGTSGKGCQIVDVAVISDGSVVFQTTYHK